ncbi:zinc transport [Fusarium pseudocircinatum]|uniref:Zinc transport n=1 Tax=Fusarium pseudocircinatum TaxID=56676 RepID=A0A8H5NU61_9HYPO|nr:zinc transport [Fusarium pseudocircinatum]
MSRLPYLDYVRRRTRTNPCVGPLAECLVEPRRQKSKTYLMESSSSSNLRHKFMEISEDNISQVIRKDIFISSRILLVEDIGPDLICLLGEALQIDPLFFANHVTTDFQDIEKAPLPPSLAMLPYLGSSANPKDIAYASKSDANIPRNIRRLPVLSGKTLGLSRCCCSIFVKEVNDVQLCLVLVDPPINHVIGRRKYGLKTAYPASRLHGGIEDFIVSELHVDVSSQTDERVWDSSSLLGCLIHHFEANPSQLNLNSPTILSMAYYAVRIILREWNLYIHAISRYFKCYEYSMNDIAHRLHNDDIIDLQRWRRRSKQRSGGKEMEADHKRHSLHAATAGNLQFWTQDARSEKPSARSA